jgi:hypothetical protein
MNPRIVSVAFLAIFGFTSQVYAATFFVRDTVAEDRISPEEARAATSLVKTAVASRTKDQAIEDEYHAEYVLQPRLMRLGESVILTVEKVRGQETLFAAQTKVARIDQLDRAARSTTYAAIDEPSMPTREHGVTSVEVEPGAPYRVLPATADAAPSQKPWVAPAPASAASAPAAYAPAASAPAASASSAPSDMASSRAGYGVDAQGAQRRVSYWSAGVGPFMGRRLASDTVMYDFMVGHHWDINPLASIKVLAEANLSSGREEARFLNFGTGASFFLPVGTRDTTPYLTGDIGYGFARDANTNSAEGFSFGTGVGVQFFRTTETTLDLLFRYAMIFDTINSGGSPSVTGLQLAVNF